MTSTPDEYEIAALAHLDQLQATRDETVREILELLQDAPPEVRTAVLRDVAQTLDPNTTHASAGGGPEPGLNPQDAQTPAPPGPSQDWAAREVRALNRGWAAAGYAEAYEPGTVRDDLAERMASELTETDPELREAYRADFVTGWDRFHDGEYPDGSPHGDELDDPAEVIAARAAPSDVAGTSAARLGTDAGTTAPGVDGENHSGVPAGQDPAAGAPEQTRSPAAPDSAAQVRPSPSPAAVAAQSFATPLTQATTSRPPAGTGGPPAPPPAAQTLRRT